MQDMRPRTQTNVEPRPDRRGLASLVQEARLLLRGGAEAEKTSTQDRLAGLWTRVAELLPDVTPDEKNGTRENFRRYCAAAAHRRVRQRQISVVARSLVGLVAAAPTVWLCVLAFDLTRPVALLAYLLTTLALVGPAWLALRGRHRITAVLIASSAGVVCLIARRMLSEGRWWDPRTILTTSDTDQERLAAGIMLGAALTVLLIVIALIAEAAQVLVARSRPGGGAGDVRAFDHLIRVTEMLTDPLRRPGDNHRPRLEEAVRNAKIALVVMVRGSRPAGWHRRWQSRTHLREQKDEASRIITEINRSNPRSGVRAVDEQLRRTVVHCLIGICDDQLGDVLKRIEPAAPVVPAAGGRGPRVSAGVRKRVRQVLGMVLPLMILLGLLHFGFPMPSVVIDLLAGFCALILVVGAFLLLFPENVKFLRGIKDILAAVGSALPSANAADAVPEEPAEDTGTATPPP